MGLRSGPGPGITVNLSIEPRERVMGVGGKGGN